MNEDAVKLAELMAAHRDGQLSSDCSDINDPGSCDTCATLDAAIGVLSTTKMPSILTAIQRELETHRVCLLYADSRADHIIGFHCALHWVKSLLVDDGTVSDARLTDLETGKANGSATQKAITNTSGD